jgi:hypothetical protein
LKGKYLVDKFHLWFLCLLCTVEPPLFLFHFFYKKI